MIVELFQGSERFLGWLLTTSWQASFLALLIVLAQVLLAKQLHPRWRYALWFLLLGRLLLPAFPVSPISVLREVPDFSPALIEAAAWTYSSPQHHGSGHAVLPFFQISGLGIVTLLWLTGVAALLLLCWSGHRRLSRHLRNAAPVTAPGLLQLLEETKSELRVQTPIRLVESDAVRSPAITGLFHPVLLLPIGGGERLDRAELRLVFLHELAHLRRGDLAVQWLLALLQILHWFNPLLWIAFHRLRADREAAADALVLSQAGEEEKERYGLTLLKLMESPRRRAAFPVLIGILEEGNSLKRRFSLIARFTRGSYGWSLAGAATLALLCVVGWTGTQRNAGLQEVVTSNVLSSDLSQAAHLIAKGNGPSDYDQALEKLLWFQDHSKGVDEQRGVRVSFSISYWHELGLKYPKAMDALLARRDHDQVLLLATGADAETFSEFAAINAELKQEERTYDLFQTLHEKFPKRARAAFSDFRFKELLVAHRNYTVFREYGYDGRKQFSQLRSIRKIELDQKDASANLRNIADRSFEEGVRETIEVLLAIGQRPEAEEIQKEALSDLDTDPIRSAISDAEVRIGQPQS